MEICEQLFNRRIIEKFYLSRNDIDSMLLNDKKIFTKNNIAEVTR